MITDIVKSLQTGLATAKDRAGQSRLRRNLVCSYDWVMRAVGANPPRKQIVICGYPRSGTSLLLNMMSATLDGFKCATFERPAQTMLLNSANCVSKMPNDVFEIERIAANNVRRKELYVVLMIRDVRDILTSMHPMLADRYYIGYESRWRPSSSGLADAVSSDKGIRRIHAAIVDAEQFAATQESVTSIRIRYEDLVQDCDGVQTVLSQILGCRFTDKFSEFHQHQDKHVYRYEASNILDSSLVRENSAIDGSRHGKWRQEKHRSRIREQFNVHPKLFELLESYGYEKDNSWFDEIALEPSDQL